MNNSVACLIKVEGKRTVHVQLFNYHLLFSLRRRRRQQQRTMRMHKEERENSEHICLMSFGIDV